MNEDQTQNFRRLALAAWLKTNGGARQACVKKGLGKSVESHISQILRGYSFGARAARNLESKLGIPHRLLDTVPLGLDETESDNAARNTDKESWVPSYSSSAAPGSEVIHIPQYRISGLINKEGASRAYSGSGARLLLRDQPGLITDFRVTAEWLDKNAHGFSSVKNLCIVTGFGDSMRPVFNPGDPLLVDTGVNEVMFDSVYFFRIEGEGFVKRIQRIPGEGLRVLSSNQSYDSWTIKSDMDFEVLGRIIKAWVSEDF